jgi:transposase InsO family protein
MISKRKLSVLLLETETGYQDTIITPKDNTDILLPNSVPYLKLATISKFESIINDAHQKGSHCGIIATFDLIKNEYYGISRDIVAEFISRCKVCQDTLAHPTKKHKPLNPIRSKSTFYHIIIDLIDYSKNPSGPSNQYKYIIHAIDHYSSYRYAEAVVNKSADEVFLFVRRLFSIIGLPVILHTDNGTEFRNSKLEDYLLKKRVAFRHGKPYTPTTQGKIERANQTLKRTMTKLIKASNNECTWHDVLYEAVHSINTNISQSHKDIPYKIVYVQEEHPRPLFSELELLAEAVDNVENSDNDTAIDLCNNNDDSLAIDEEIPLEVTNATEISIVASTFRQQIDLQIDKSIRLMRKNHDKSLKITKFSIGDIVGVFVPKEYSRNSANKLPAVVVGYTTIEEILYYILGYQYQVISGNFLASDLVPLNAYAFVKYVGIDQNDIHDESIYAHWGYDDEKEDHLFISLREAYEHYLSQERIENELKEDQKEDCVDDTIDTCTSSRRKRINATNPIILASQNSSFTSLGSSSLDHKCAMCDQELSSSSVFIKCNRCNSKMHCASECIYGIIQYRDEKTKSDYCSLACFKKYDLFEVEIVGETTRNYKIKYSNGDIMAKAKRIVEKHAEFYKILTIYRRNKR